MTENPSQEYSETNEGNVQEPGTQEPTPDITEGSQAANPTPETPPQSIQSDQEVDSDQEAEPVVTQDPSNEPSSSDPRNTTGNAT